MPFCCYDVSVIKCLSAVAGCHPGRPFQSPLRAAGSCSVAGMQSCLWWHRGGAEFWGWLQLRSLPGTEGVQGSEGSAVSPAAADPGLPCCLLFASNPVPLVHCPAPCQHWGTGLGQSQWGEFCEPLNTEGTVQRTKHVSPSYRLDLGIIFCITTGSYFSAGWGSIFREEMEGERLSNAAGTAASIFSPCGITLPLVKWIASARCFPCCTAQTQDGLGLCSPPQSKTNTLNFLAANKLGRAVK